MTGQPPESAQSVPVSGNTATCAATAPEVHPARSVVAGGWRVLVSAADRDRRRQLVAACQSPRLPRGVTIESADPHDALAQLRPDQVDCLLLDLPVLDAAWLARLQPLGEHLRGTFCVVTAQRASADATRQSQSAAGWLRILPGEPLESDRVIGQLQQLSRAMGYDTEQRTFARRSSETDQRGEHRFDVVRPIMGVPVGSDDAPLRDSIVYGYTTDFSVRGVRFQLPGTVTTVPKRWVVGVEDTHGDMHFGTALTRNVGRDRSGQMVVGTEIVRDTRDVFFATRIQPQFDPVTLRVETGMNQDVRTQWVELGILEPQFLDYMLVCPECEGLITWRRGCCHCGGARVHCQQLIHHYACAHVGPVRHFEHASGLVCPKCRCTNLVVGVDFEYQNGEFVCAGCGWTDSHLDDVAQCLRCQLRFPGNQAMEKELLGYHFRRLDPLAFIGTT